MRRAAFGYVSAAMFVIVAHCVFPLLSLRLCSHPLMMLHNEIHPSQLGGVAVCCGVGAAVSLLNWGFTYDKQLLRMFILNGFVLGQKPLCACMTQNACVCPHMLVHTLQEGLRGRWVNYLRLIRNIFIPPHSFIIH